MTTTYEPAPRICPLTCIIVTFNSAAWISRSLRALLASDVPGLEVIVVDNASTDGTVAACAVSDAVDVVALDENIGFSRACNLAGRRARGEFLLFLNPDTELQPHAVMRALGHLRDHPDVGVVGGRTLYPDGSPNLTCCFREPSLWSAFCSATGLSSVFRRSSFLNPEHMGAWDRTDDREVDVVTGCCLMLRKSLFDVLEGFDERFFLYSEDTDLCRRVRDRGLTCMHLARVELVHAGGASEPERAEKVTKVMRAKSQYYRKHWSPIRARLGILLLDATVVSRRMAHRIARDREGAARWSEVWRHRPEWRRRPHDEEHEHAAVSTSTTPLSPQVPLRARRWSPRARMTYRWTRHLARSVRSHDYDFALQAAGSLARLPVLIGADVARQPRRRCNICSWSGAQFYPNTGPGYHELATTCPGCGTLDRHRSLVALLASSTTCFEPGTRVVEVAPMRGFEALARRQPGVDYTSFDLARHAMEQGDITAMRFECDSVDYFVCFHVLEHIADEAKALAEIRRVLRPGGTAILQVPVDWQVAETYEYDAPDPREVGHVRRYGRDLAVRLEHHGFDVDAVTITDLVDHDVVQQFGLSDEPIFLARKPGGPHP